MEGVKVNFQEQNCVNLLNKPLIASQRSSLSYLVDAASRGGDALFTSVVFHQAESDHHILQSANARLSGILLGHPLAVPRLSTTTVLMPTTIF